MSIEINYSDVLADLRLKQTALEQAITGITTLMKLGTVSGGGPAPISSSADPSSPVEIPSDAFFGVSIVEATKKYLGMMKRPKTTQEIAAALVEGGYNHTSKNFYSTIFSVLARESGKPTGEIVKVNDRWGLAEWYPNRRPTRSSRRNDVEISAQADSVQQDDSQATANEAEPEILSSAA